MKVIDTLEMMGDRLQVAIVVCDFPDESGDLTIRYANIPAAYLFGYQQTRDLVGMDVLTLMPEEIAKHHRGYVQAYMQRYLQSGGHVTQQSTIMGSWRALHAVRRDGSMVPVHANVADIKNSDERYLVAIFRDRTPDIKAEQEQQRLLDELQAEKDRAEVAMSEALTLKEKAESALLKEKKLSAQVTLLKQIFTGTVGLVAMLGCLIIASWVTGNKESKDALAMIERVLLVMTGILGSAMASVFDSRSKIDQ